MLLIKFHELKLPVFQFGASLVAHMIKNLPAVQGTRFNPWVRKIPGGGHGNPLQYSCLENSTTLPYLSS